MNLKELTWENHKNAERKKFAHILMSGKITPKLYYKYLTNQYYAYVMLEESLRLCGLDEEHHSVFRAEKIRSDLQELEEKYGLGFDPALITRSVTEYISYVEDIQQFGTPPSDLSRLIAHMYVRHFGDMYGGAMIQKRIPGSGTMYDFEDKEELKASLRGLLNDDMADEANRCFEFAIRLFEELCDDSMG